MEHGLESKEGVPSKLSPLESLALALQTELSDSLYEKLHHFDAQLRAHLCCRSSVAAARQQQTAETEKKLFIQREGRAEWVDVDAAVQWIINTFHPLDELVEFKVVVDATDAVAAQHHVWVLLQILNKRFETGTPQESIYPLLVYAGKESTKEYADNRVNDILADIRQWNGATWCRDDGSIHNFKVMMTCDLKSTWALLGMDVRADHELCPICHAASGHLHEAGAKRLEWAGELGIANIVNEWAFCFLHAWLRLGSQRMDLLYARTKKLTSAGKLDTEHSEAAALTLLAKLKLRPWRKTKKSKHFTWLELDDVEALIEKNNELCQWEYGAKGDPTIWSDLYSVYSWLECGVNQEDFNNFQVAADAAFAKFVHRYGKGSVRVYQHIIIHHGLELQTAHHRPLGEFSNQLAEASHHLHKMATRGHTFLNGKRLLKGKVVLRQACHEVLSRDWMAKQLLATLARRPFQKTYSHRPSYTKRPSLKKLKFTRKSIPHPQTPSPLSALAATAPTIF